MASVNVDPNAWLTFALRWLFAGLWGAIGWALAHAFILPHVPGV